MFSLDDRKGHGSMIKKLRQKFILTNMLLVSLVLIIVFGVLLGTNYRRLVSQSQTAMRFALDWKDRPPRLEIGGPRPDNTNSGNDEPSKFSIVPVFSVLLDKDGNASTLQTNTVTVSDEVLAQAVKEAQSGQDDMGVISSLNLRYLRQTGFSGTRIAFADTTWETDSLLSLVRSSLLVGAGALVCFFLISLFLSKIALRPVEKAWEQQRRFVADASHELRTPITVILTNTGILLSHPKDTIEAQAKWVTYIQSEAQQMKGLVEDLLFLARNDHTRPPISPASLSMSDLVTGCLLAFESVAFEKGVALESSICPDVSVRGNPEQLRRLVVILLDNACKYAPSGGTIGLTLECRPEGVQLSVRNTGEPIPPEHLPHLFERFYRIDSARTHSEGGYGLGLAIAKSITEAHSGTITVRSSAAEGTAFTVLLPKY